MLMHSVSICTGIHVTVEFASRVFTDMSVVSKACFPANLTAPLCLFLADKSSDSGFLSTHLILA